MVQTKIQPTAQRFALFMWVAGQWAYVNTYATLQAATKHANQLKTNRRMYNQLRNRALHRIKYPIVGGA